MINKKILAVAVATAFSANTFAAIDLDAAGTTADPIGTVQVATETYTATDLDTDGNLTVTTAALLDASATAGFTINLGTSKYVRIDLANAEFTGTPSLTTDGDATAAPGDFSANVSAGGAAGDDYVIFEVTDPTEDILTADTFTLDLASLDVKAGSTATMQYRLFNSAPGAVNETAGDQLKDTGAKAIVTFGSANNGKIAIADTAEATVASTFTAFTVDSAAPATPNYATAAIARVGELSVANALVAGSITPAGAAVATTDIFDASQQVTFKGDFSFGTWSTSTANDCTALTALTLSADKSEATTVATFNVNSGDVYLCVTVDTTETIEKSASAYTVELDDDGFTDDMGTITYDTTSVSIPYLSVFSGVNQKVYLVNNSSVDASYSTSFKAEAGVVVASGSKGTGTIPANSMITVKASELATFTSGTRTSATIEVEGVDTAILATTQVVNKSTGGTDTMHLAVSSKF